MNEIPMMDIGERVDRALDDALNMTFPASDPIAIFVPAPAKVDDRVAQRQRAETESPIRR